MRIDGRKVILMLIMVFDNFLNALTQPHLFILLPGRKTEGCHLLRADTFRNGPKMS
jgi:hypothetical protein